MNCNTTHYRANSSSVPGDPTFDAAHPALRKRGADVVAFDYARGVADFQGAPDPTHGTHVAAIATQGTDRLVPLCFCVLERGARGLDLKGMSEAVEHAARAGARVVNFSVATTTPEEVAQARAVILAHPDILFVIGAGNRAQKLGEGPFAPDVHVAAHDFDNVCVVTSQADGKLAWGSGFGGTTDIAARGEHVYSATVNAAFASYSGTSMASPQVANVAAKCLVLDPALTPRAVNRILELTADKSEALAGVVRADGAVNSARACRLAALARSVREGASVVDALARLAIPDDERAPLMAALAALRDDDASRSAGGPRPSDALQS